MMVGQPPPYPNACLRVWIHAACSALGLSRAIYAVNTDLNWFGGAGHGVDCWLRNTGAQTYSFLWIFPGFVSMPCIVGTGRGVGGVTRPVCFVCFEPLDRFTTFTSTRKYVHDPHPPPFFVYLSDTPWSFYNHRWIRVDAHRSDTTSAGGC
jgi:hypothetical protein